MSDHHKPDGERDEFEIVVELPPSRRGTYQYEREDGKTVLGDASGEWIIDTSEEVEDIVFFASPRWLADLDARGRQNPKSPTDRSER